MILPIKVLEDKDGNKYAPVTVPTAVRWPDGSTIDDKFGILEAVGMDAIPVFDNTKEYNTGDFVMYNGKMYKFTSHHDEGNWDASEVTETSLVEEIDNMVKSDYEQVVILLKTEDSTPLENVLVAVQVEGEQSARNLTTDSTGRCTTSVSKGLGYTIDCNNVTGYYPVDTIVKRASLPTRLVEVTYIEEDTVTNEHLVVNVTYSTTPETPAEHVTVSYGGQDYQLTLVNNTANTDIPIGTVYTVTFDDVTGYKTPATRTYTASLHGTRPVNVKYQAAVAGVKWLMKNNTEKDLNAVVAADEENIFGLIIQTSELLDAGCGYVIPYKYLLAGAGSGQYLSVSEQVTTLNMYGTAAAALNDKDGSYNCDKILEYIDIKAEQGVTRSSSMVTGCRNVIGGIPTFSEAESYAVDDYVVYSGKIYQFTLAHAAGAWDGSDVTEIGYGWLMPDGVIRRCFSPAWAQLRAFSVNRNAVNTITEETFGVTCVAINNNTWWSSTQSNASNGVYLNGGSFLSGTKGSSTRLCPVLAY